MDNFIWIEEWLAWAKSGALNGKPLADRTVHLYRYYFNFYLKFLEKDINITNIIAVDNYRKVLNIIPPASYSTRYNIFASIMSAGKYLIQKELLEKNILDEIKVLSPKRLFPAKKPCLNEQQIRKLLADIQRMPIPRYGKILNRTLVLLMLHTGLRRAEVANLKLQHVDLQNSRLYVHLGKGNKNRNLGLNREIEQALKEYLKARPNSFSDSFFVSAEGNSLDNDQISKRFQRFSKRLGFTVTPHSLRRAFVTINAGKGKPIVHLQIACGHADINTTRAYCQTSENEVIEAMKNW